MGEAAGDFKTRLPAGSLAAAGREIGCWERHDGGIGCRTMTGPVQAAWLRNRSQDRRQNDDDTSRKERHGGRLGRRAV
ncbi:hypothetical protein ACE6ED_19765 [Paenibacillus sp. CN-4]|uniref:hypothetical protein n=1 Tax=Paenibacillus nanchangensis TaxID=3348343 RepID=UPI003979092D